jgi:hypothetical protein
MRVIVKAQIPLSTSLSKGKELALIYSEDKSIEFMPPVDQDLLSWFPKGVFKIYVEAEYSDQSSKIQFIKIVKDQEW